MSQLKSTNFRLQSQIPRHLQAFVIPALPAVSFAEPEQNTIQRAGFFLVSVYVFALFSMFSEISIEAFGIKPYISIVVGPLAMLACLISGTLQRAFQTKTGLCFLGLILWMAIGLPFSSWRGGSARYLWDAFLKNYSIFFMIAALVTGLRRTRNFFYLIALCGALDLVASVFFGESQNGRFSLRFGTLGNPNDFATHLLFVAPFVLFVFVDKPALRAVSGLTGVFMLFTVVRTGSRGGLLALLGMALFILLRAKPSQKVVMVAIGIMVVAGALVFLPSASVTRFALLTGDQADANTVAAEEATGSTAARRHLLERSIDLTFEHPVFGVGAGQFASAEAGEAAGAGTRAAWQLTHNTYTEFSSEDGIPSLILFLLAIFASGLMNSRVYRETKGRPELKQIANMAFCLLSCTAGLMVSIFFASLAARFYIPTLLGLSVALHMAVKPVFSQYPARKLYPGASGGVRCAG